MKQLAIGVAEASSWFIGGRPRISSIVRTMLVWLYCVLSTRMAPRVGADDHGHGAMAIDVVEAVLRIVLDDENARVAPELAVADGLDDSPEGQVVVGHRGGGRRRSRSRAGRVVVGQQHDHEIRQVAVLLELFQLADELRRRDARRAPCWESRSPSGTDTAPAILIAALASTSISPRCVDEIAVAIEELRPPFLARRLSRRSLL